MPDDNKWDFDEHAKELVEEIFAKCINGWGIYKITKWLNSEGILTFTQKKIWTAHAVHNLLRDKVAIGEIHFSTGLVVKDYYPPVVTETVFYKAQAALDNRTQTNGKPRSNQTTITNLFTGIAFFGKSTACTCDKGTTKYILATDGISGASDYQAFPYKVFEECFLRELKELTPSDLTPAVAKEDKIAILTGKLRRLESDIQKTKARRKSGEEIDTILDILEDLGREKNALTIELEQEKTKEHKGDELKQIKQTLEDWSCIQKPDMRIRLKSMLRGMIKEIQLNVEWKRTANAKIVKRNRRLFIQEGKMLTLG